MSCKYCNDSDHYMMARKELCINDICILSGESKIDMTGNQLLEFEESLMVYIDRGYLRMTNDDSACIDHGEKIKINFCPMCGEWLTNPEKLEKGI